MDASYTRASYVGAHISYKLGSSIEVFCLIFGQPFAARSDPCRATAGFSPLRPPIIRGTPLSKGLFKYILITQQYYCNIYQYSIHIFRYSCIKFSTMISQIIIKYITSSHRIKSNPVYNFIFNNMINMFIN